MTETTSHIGAFVSLIDLLPDTPVTEKGRQIPPSGTLALSKLLALDPKSINFGKVVLWVSAFVHDGEDALNRCSLKDGDKKAAIRLFSDLTSPFVYSFPASSIADHKKSLLSQERRSYMSLLDEVILREFPIFVPDKNEIQALIDRLQALVLEFEKFDVPEYVKVDFRRSIELYSLVASHLPVVAHRLIAEESSRLISWLLYSIPDDAKKVVAKTALTLNILVAAFVAPTEAYDAASSYYRWYSDTAINRPAIEATVAPRALPKPAKSRDEKRER